MLEQLIELDTEIFLYLNSKHNPFFDGLMYAISGKKIWFPLYLAIFGHLIYTYRKKAIIPILSLVLLIGLADFTASKIFKPNAKRYRPTHERTLEGMVHTVDEYEGGTYGFFSSHASTTYVFSFFLVFLLGKQKKYYYWLLLWASVIAYSRIYLGVHYPLDILAGAFCGLLYAWAFINIKPIKKIALR